MARRKGDRLKWRGRGKGPRRAYGDFRDYADVGGEREALIPAGETLATTDEVIARKLLAERLVELERRRRDRTLLGIERIETLGDFAEHHLREKAMGGRLTPRYLVDQARYLDAAIRFFGGERALTSIGVRDVSAYASHLRTLPNHAGGTIGERAQRGYLQALENLYVRAGAEACVSPGYNPVSAMIEKPSMQSEGEGEWLEVWEAALVLEAARNDRPGSGPWKSIPFVYPLVATYLLTGARAAEVLGLEVSDVRFQRGVITIQPNDWRRVKTRRSRREVPLWPQLRAILLEYLNGPDRPAGALLFPSPRAEDDRMVDDLRVPLARIARAAGWREGDLSPLLFRHTYATTRRLTVERVWTTDGSLAYAPVSERKIEQEMGHTSGRLLKLIYTHLPRAPWRSEAVEYRLEQHQGVIPPARLKLVA